MSRAAELWAASGDLAEACLAHPFVRGIATGELPRRPFVFYVGQDAFYLDAYVRAYALALAKSPDREGMGAFLQLLEGAFRERGLHEGYAARWGADLHPAPAEATQAYTDFLLRVAWSEPVGRIAAAMTPCMRLYAHLGRGLRPGLAPGTPYREWVETYGDPAFEALAAQLEALLDRYDDGSEALAAHYRTAMRLELAFFEQAWRA